MLTLSRDGTGKGTHPQRSGLNGMVKTALRIAMSTRRFDSTLSRGFGRRRPFVHAAAAPAPTAMLSDDTRLFLLNFAGGFLFMAVYLA